MVDGDCCTEECSFTGSLVVSDATLGPCTSEGGILANAEILEILDDSSRVKHNFLDQHTHSNVLVYDDNQFISWMSEDVKQEHQIFYQALVCDSEDLGPRKDVARIAITNLFVKIKAIYRTVEDAVADSAACKINSALDSFSNDLAPVPPEPDNTGLLLLLDILTIGASAALGLLFKNVIAKLPKFAAAGSTVAANLEDTTILAVQQGTTLAKDLASKDP
ncbi:glycoside hydrolase family 18 protein [Emericellopsis cladophorae]|uniref:Glycoside hydrolase family 18 protein n=1 Tax=Emericellopsis cladophorae TaxID=2686198 RepID=A0A9P9XUI1_9HYPO|nr:glycoside hydrolase family 18 protein [Emericellopsis cladophorae]KAI6778036.1 glycoside hydrolase family 18 protein [Emericellopsis cladophorae]